ncbi:MAG: hypothetical protein ACE5O2_10100 [Armatimonadota bacterium]
MSAMKRYRVVMEDGSEVSFQAAGVGNIDVEVRPEDSNIWRVMDADGNLVFAAQGVSYICEVQESGQPADEVAAPAG